MTRSFDSTVLIRDARLRSASGWTTLGCLVLSPLLLGVSYSLDIAAIAHVSVWILGLMLAAIVTYYLASVRWFRLVHQEESKLEEATFDVTRGDFVVKWQGEGRQPRSFALSSIVSAWMGDAGRVEIVLADKSEVVVGGLSAQDRHELFRALGTTAADRTSITRVASVSHTMPGCLIIPSLVLIPVTGCFGVALLFDLTPGIVGFSTMVAESQFGTAFVFLGQGAFFNLVVFGALYVLVEFHRRRTLIIGTDGIALTTFGRRTFVAMSRIKEVRYEQGGVRLIHHDRPDLFFAGAKEALARRIQEAMDVGGESGALGPRYDLLDRRKRDVDDWVAALRNLASTEGHYRKAAFQTKLLIDLAVDADVSPERRVAAAYALSTVAKADELEAVRKAAKACADDHLRRALEHAADGHIAERELERAMKRFRAGR